MASRTSIAALRKCFVDRVRGGLNRLRSGPSSRNIQTAQDGTPALAGSRRARVRRFRFVFGIVPPQNYHQLTFLDTSAQRFTVGDPLRQ